MQRYATRRDTQCLVSSGRAQRAAGQPLGRAGASVLPVRSGAEHCPTWALPKSDTASVRIAMRPPPAACQWYHGVSATKTAPAERVATDQSGWNLRIPRDRRSTVVSWGEARGRATTSPAQKGRLDTGPARTCWPTRCFWLASLAAARSWDKDTWTSVCHPFYVEGARRTTHEMSSIVCTQITKS